MASPAILLVDDERALRDGIKAALEGEGYAVTTARDGEEALKKIAAQRPDLVLLDVMMPKMNGFRCCEEIRKADAVLPVVFLTAKDSEADQVRGIGLGADDYVSKDAADAVLFARIARALARVKSLTAEIRERDGDVLRLGKVTVDAGGGVVVEEGREIARLTRTELDLLKVFCARRGETLVTDDLITELRGNGYACEDSMLFSHVYHLRGKLGSAAALLVHRRGLGYCLVK